MKERNNMVALVAFDCIVPMKTLRSKPVSNLRFQRFFNEQSDIFVLIVGSKCIAIGNKLSDRKQLSRIR